MVAKVKWGLRRVAMYLKTGSRSSRTRWGVRVDQEGEHGAITSIVWKFLLDEISFRIVMVLVSLTRIEWADQMSLVHCRDSRSTDSGAMKIWPVKTGRMLP
jgi:hypothetical protein